MPMNAAYRGPSELPPVIPVFPLPARCCCRAGRCR